MLNKIFKFGALSLASLYTIQHTFTKSQPSNNKSPFSWFLNRVHCLQTLRANKPQIIKLLNTTKQQTIILIYNKEIESSLKEQIMNIQDICEENNVNKIILVDQTDIRHLQTFSNMVRDQQPEVRQQYQQEAVDLQGKLKIYYVNPNYDTNKPFNIGSKDSLKQQLQQIRNYVVLNPSSQQVNKSMKTFNKATILKNCYNQTCIDQFRQKVRTLIQLQLLRGKLDNYTFYITTNKAQANKVNHLFQSTSQNTNKQEIFIHRDDILGQEQNLYSKWLEEEGKDIVSANRFLMFIRPRVHIISKINYYTDILWYMSVLRNKNIPTFSINSLVDRNWKSEIKGPENIVNDQQLLKELNQKYAHRLLLMVIQTRVMSELIRHVYQPWRYTIFHLKNSVPYPKMYLYPFKIVNQSKKKNNFHKSIENFLKNPKNYDPIRRFSDKEMEINSDKFIELLEKTENQKWVIRMCNQSNDCSRSVYKKYKLPLSTKVYTMDANIQNVGLDAGDYYFQDNNLHKFV